MYPVCVVFPLIIIISDRKDQEEEIDLITLIFCHSIQLDHIIQTHVHKLHQVIHVHRASDQGTLECLRWVLTSVFEQNIHTYIIAITS